MKQSSVLAYCLLAGLPAVLPAAPGPDGRRQAEVARIGPGEAPPAVDGRLDDPIWARATPLTDFIQRRPNAGSPSAYRTVGKLAVDDQALYVAIHAYDPEPQRIVARLSRRDDFTSSDIVGVMVDSDLDRRTAFMFLVNPAEVKLDAIIANGQDDDERWDAVWDVEAEIVDDGWVAEFRIPLSMLRFSTDGDGVWGIQLGRIVQRTDEESFWGPTPAQDPNFVSFFGELKGFAGLAAPRRLELLPYTLAQYTREPGDAADPFYDENAYKLSAGVDLKYGLTSNLTLDATINPDFGQVEADPSEVNLSAFETFFEERRPFFVEGAEIFNYGLGVGDGDIETLFYSRRIGRAPQGSVDDRGGYADAPIQTSILGAAKLSGRTSGGWSVGVLEAVTGEEEAEVLSADGERFTDTVEPLTNYTVARLRKDLREGATQIGAVTTGVHRALNGTGLDDRLRSSAYAGGIDLTHRFRDNQWRLSGRLLGSTIRGSEPAILRAQRSSARYFQRPDAGHVEVDSSATSLSGWASAVEIMKESGGPWRGAAFVITRSPGFEVNDVGFMRETDQIGVGGFGGYRLLQPNRFLRRGNLNVNGWTYDNFDGLLVARGGNVNGSVQLHNQWWVFGGLARNFDNWSTDALRGGAAIVEPGETFGWFGVESDERRRFQIEVDGEVGREDDTDGRWFEFEVEGAWQVTSGARLSLGPFFEDRTGAWQYVDTADDPGENPHYVFAEIRQRTFGLTTRVDYTLTPRLTIQLYAQPFVSAGDYRDFMEVIDPRADRFEDRFGRFGANRITLEEGSFGVDLDGAPGAEIEFDDPDFNFRELRSTLVARWEYRPGSTAYLVWSQDRSSEVTDPRFRLGDDFSELFDADARNVFLIKINGWLNL